MVLDIVAAETGLVCYNFHFEFNAGIFTLEDVNITVAAFMFRYPADRLIDFLFNLLLDLFVGRRVKPAGAGAQ